MICFFNSNCNPTAKKFWEIPLVDFYDDCIKAVRSHTASFFLPCIQRLALPDNYYGRFSLRYVIYHLSQFLSKDTSIEDYCLDHSFSIPTFTKWLRWMENHISILREVGLFQDKKQNRKTLNEWILEIKARSTDWLVKSLRLLNLSLFQCRPMPDNTM